MEKNPEIHFHHPVDNDILNQDRKRQSPEPEVEENCEDSQLHEVLQSLGLQTDTLSKFKSITHIQPSSTCLHCKLLEKVKTLKTGIQKLNDEIQTTEHILNTKRTQNSDIKTIINRIEGSLTAIEVSPDQKTNTKTCSCTNSCTLI